MIRDKQWCILPSGKAVPSRMVVDVGTREKFISNAAAALGSGGGSGERRCFSQFHPSVSRSGFKISRKPRSCLLAWRFECKGA